MLNMDTTTQAEVLFLASGKSFFLLFARIQLQVFPDHCAYTVVETVKISPCTFLETWVFQAMTHVSDLTF